MIWQPKNTKKIFLIFFSVILGVIFIFGATIMSGLIGDKKTTAQNEEWRDGLSVVPEPSSVALVKKSSVATDEALQEATTTTDIISRKLLIEYVLSQNGATSSTMSDADIQKIAATLAQEIKLPPQKKYALADLNISRSNTPNENLLYIRSLSVLLKNFVATSQKETELTLLKKVVDTDDTVALDKIKEKVAIYQKLIKDLLVLKTPSQIAPIHLRLVQGYEMLRSSTVGFKTMLSDPAVGIASMAEYRKGVDVLMLAEKDLHEFNFLK